MQESVGEECDGSLSHPVLPHPFLRPLAVAATTILAEQRNAHDKQPQRGKVEELPPWGRRDSVLICRNGQYTSQIATVRRQAYCTALEATCRTHCAIIKRIPTELNVAIPVGHLIPRHGHSEAEGRK